MAKIIWVRTWRDYTKYGQTDSQWILTPTSRCLSEKPTKNFRPRPSVALTWRYGEGRKHMLALKASEFASPAIKTALIPNANINSVKHKQWKLLTKTPRHMGETICTHKQTMHKAQTYPADWKLANLPKLLRDESESDDNWRLGSALLLLKKKMWKIQLRFQKDMSLNALSILCIKLTSCASFWHSQAFIF